MYRPSVNVKTIAPAELPSLFSAIEKLMREAERITEEAADEHLRAFIMQMRDKFGVDEIVLDEPYLPETLASSSLKFLTALERLMEKIERGAEDDDFRTSILDFDEPLMPQLNTRLQLETARHKLAAKQGLDKTRQQAFGVQKFVWRAGDTACEICAPLDGLVFSWEDGTAPGDTHPNCQCSAEPLLDDADEPKVEVAHLDKLAAFAALAAKIVQRAAAKRRAAQRAAEEAAKKPKPTPPKPAEAPKPPAKPKPDISKRPDKVPKDWKQTPSNKGEGVRYRDPKNPHNEVRVQKGKPEVSNPSQQQDYVKWKRDGQWLDKDGKPVPGDSPEAHIPIEDFKFDPGLFK